MELKQIEYDYENAHISYALQRLNTEKDITNQFYSVYMAQSQLAITREELVNAQQSYEIKRIRWKLTCQPKTNCFRRN